MTLFTAIDIANSIITPKSQNYSQIIVIFADKWLFFSTERLPGSDDKMAQICQQK